MQGFNHQTVRLSPGRHRGPDEGVCVMELASMLAGEPFSDRPRSVSFSIAAVLRGLNDGLDDARRQELKRFAAASIGTAGDRAVEKRRRRVVRSSILEATTGPSTGTSLLRRLAVADPYSAARAVGHRVATSDDDVLHARMLGMLDELVRMGRSPEESAFDAGALLAVPSPAREANEPPASLR